MQIIVDTIQAMFFVILNMSITASVIIVFVFLSRLCLKRAPRGFSYALWAVVLFRLLCPISFELPVTALSLTGASPADAAQLSTMQYIQADWAFQQNNTNSTVGASVGTNDAISASNASDSVVGVTDESTTATTQDTEVVADSAQGLSFNILTMVGAIWLLGAVGLFGANCFSLLRLKKKLRPALRYGGETYAALAETPIYRSDAIPTAFVLGGLKPCIFLPMHLSMQEQSYILRHEQVHIARRDHLWQALAFLALCLHWFNPLVWFAFKASQKDMELSCDERVLRQMGNGIKKEYAQSLLNLSQGQNPAMYSVLAFGESDATSRIKNVLSYRKPMLWVSLFANVALIVAVVLLVANPVALDKSDLQGASTESVDPLNTSSEVQSEAIQTDTMQPQTSQVEEGLLEEALYTGLNLDGLGKADDNACVKVYRWDESGRADVIVVSVQLGTGEETAYTVPSAEYCYEWGASLTTGALFSTEKDAIILEVPVPQSTYGAADIYVLDIYGASNGESPVIVERLNTQADTMRLPSGIKAEISQLGIAGNFTDGTQVVSLEENDLQGLLIYTTGTTGDWHDTAQTICYTENGWEIIKE